MNNLHIFTDGSINPQLKIGYGAVLMVDDISQTLQTLKSEVKTQRFENTSSTKLEIQTLLLALSQIKSNDHQIIVYTDSQNLTGLLDRRKRLEAKNFQSKKNEIIQNAALYKEFYELHDRLNFTLVKIKGHQPSKAKSTLDQIFNLVDRASRIKLRTELLKP